MDGSVDFTLTAGDITSEVTNSDSGDRYFYALNALSFLAGQVSRYTITNAGSTNTSVIYEGGVPVRYTNNLVYTTSTGTQTWQVSVTKPVREAGDNRPDQGGLMITGLSATKVLNVSFNPNNTVTIEGGEQGGARNYSWDETSLQNALHASHL